MLQKLTLAALLLLTVSLSFADAPQKINYQGRLTTSAGEPMPDTTLDITFSIYRSDDIQVWSSGPQPVEVVDGVFNYVLGSSVSLPVSVISAQYSRFLGIKVGDDEEIVPRTELVSVPYAYRVGTIDGASGGGISGSLDIAEDIYSQDDYFEVFYPSSILFQSDEVISADFMIGSLFLFDADAGTLRLGSAASGYRLPGVDGGDGQVLITDGGGQVSWTDPPSGGNWTVTDSVLSTNSFWGLNRGGVGNALYGDSAQTHVNWGVACTTGTSGFDYYHATVAGGYGNKASGNYTTTGGGNQNLASGLSCVVAGGSGNTSSGEGSTVGGGNGNSAGGLHGTVGGGSGNNALNLGTVSGGQNNSATGFGSAIGGGTGNQVTGDFSVVPGGSSNSASQPYTFAAGFNANAVHPGSFVWADFGGAAFSSTGNNQFLIRTAGGVGINTNNPGAALHIGGTPGTDGLMFPDGSLQTTAASNWRLTDDVLYTERYYGIARGEADNVLYGDSARTHVNLGVACTTGVSGVHRYYTTVSGGFGNRVQDHFSTIGGGQSNVVAGENSYVGGGYGNSVLGDSSVISGGVGNTVITRCSFIGGGGNHPQGSPDHPIDANIIDGSSTSGYSSIVGGAGNYITGGPFNSILGGEHNKIDFDVISSWIGGGINNLLEHLSYGSAICAGEKNTIRDRWSFCGAGYENDVFAEISAIVCGGYPEFEDLNPVTERPVLVNRIDSSAWNSFIGCGWGNRASDSMAVVLGGVHNYARGKYSVVVGGGANFDPMMGFIVPIDTNSASGDWSAIVCGKGHVASGLGSFIGGGTYGRASGDYSVVAGGGGINPADSNVASGNASVVSGGVQNYSTGIQSTVAGGNQNTASGQYSVVGGGGQNLASGLCAAVPGGYKSAARGQYSVALGNRAKANYSGSVVIAANSSASNTDSTRAGGNEQMVLRVDGGLYLTNIAETAPYDVTKLITTRGGAYLSGYGGTWTNSSDRNKKENFKPVDGEKVLSLLQELDITEWNYKSDEESVRHIGPVSQDFYALFGLGGDDKAISTVDPAGIALAAIKELDRRNQELESEVAELKALVNELLSRKQ